MPVYQNQTNDTITVLTSEQVAIHMSQPTDKGLSVQQKAEMYRDEIQWSRVGNPFALSMVSPRSGDTHVVTLDPATGAVSCSCPASRACYHSLIFTWEWKPLLLQAARQSAVSRTHRIDSYTATSLSTISKSQRVADWNN